MSVGRCAKYPAFNRLPGFIATIIAYRHTDCLLRATIPVVSGAELAYDYLDTASVVVDARNWITPPDEVEHSFFPFTSDILDAVHTHIRPEGHAGWRK